MKTLTLKEMRLINFGCFKDYSIEFAPEKNVIAGANGSGKTTIADAFSWVFTDKLMNGTSGDPMPHDEQGRPLSNGETIVTIYASVNDLDYIFEKLARRTYKGNDHIYSVNGVQMGAKAFREALIDIFGVTQEQFGLCISAAHFLKNDTATRRSILFNQVDIDGDYKLADDSAEFKEIAYLFSEDEPIESHLKTFRKAINGSGKCNWGLLGEINDNRVRANENGYALSCVRNEQLLARSAEIDEVGKTLTKRLVDLERTMDLLKRFAKYKTEVYAERINAEFGTAEFVFTEPTNTGDPKDICDLRYKGERYGKRLNTGARVIMDCDIVKGFQKAYGVQLPLFIDNAESLTMSSIKSVRDGVAQYIALVAEDCELTIEH